MRKVKRLHQLHLQIPDSFFVFRDKNFYSFIKFSWWNVDGKKFAHKFFFHVENECNFHGALERNDFVMVI